MKQEQEENISNIAKTIRGPKRSTKGPINILAGIVSATFATIKIFICASEKPKTKINVELNGAKLNHAKKVKKKANHVR